MGSRQSAESPWFHVLIPPNPREWEKERKEGEGEEMEEEEEENERQRRRKEKEGEGRMHKEKQRVTPSLPPGPTQAEFAGLSPTVLTPDFTSKRFEWEWWCNFFCLSLKIQACSCF